MDTITIDSVTCRGQHMPRGYASVLATLRSLAKGNLASTTVSVVIRTPARNGLASVTDAGAAAAAAFVVTVAAVLAADEAYNGQFAQLARKIGGLACTSLVGGFVKWSASTVATKEDDEIEPAGDNDMAMARRTAPEETSVAACICEPHAGLANDVRTITVVVSPEASQLRALAGSQTNAADEGRIAQASLDRFATAAARSVTTSPLLTHRVEKVVPARLHAVESCVARGDFEGLARLACAESNQVAAICSDTAPPLYFMSDVTRRVVAIVERYNHHVGRTAAAYTSAPLSASVTVIVKGAADEAAMLARLLHAFPAMPSSGRTLLAPRLESAKAEADADVMSLPFVRGLGVTEKLSALGIKALGDLASLTPPPESPNAVVWPDSVYGIVVGGVGAGAHAEDIAEDPARRAERPNLNGSCGNLLEACRQQSVLDPCRMVGKIR